jgi:hypothetical protein
MRETALKAPVVTSATFLVPCFYCNKHAVICVDGEVKCHVASQKEALEKIAKLLVSGEISYSQRDQLITHLESVDLPEINRCPFVGTAVDRANVRPHFGCIQKLIDELRDTVRTSREVVGLADAY